MRKREKEPSEVLADFLNYIDQCRRDYQAAHDAVGMEDKRLELIVKFFDEPNPKNTLNKMRQLLGKQRKEEEYLNGERHYNNRIEE